VSELQMKDADNYGLEGKRIKTAREAEGFEKTFEIAESLAFRQHPKQLHAERILQEVT
jgi:hypothetical protein